MEDRSNKTVMCSVLFLDIVEYSKKSVTGQISLKERFNTYLTEAIHDVPVADRIILDTGDGAAVNFLMDVESALKAALRLRTSLLDEDTELDPPLLVRIGINMGPVRLVRDINGQPNIVGDGINVAQRVMAFADPSQILVSRTYYDAVSRLSVQYTGMFHYQGSRTDKHVREHEIYAIGYPGDQTTKQMLAHPGEEATLVNSVGIQKRVEEVGHSIVAGMAGLSEQIKPSKVLVRYAALITILGVTAALIFMFAQKSGDAPSVAAIQAPPPIETMASAVPAEPVVSTEKTKLPLATPEKAKVKPLSDENKAKLAAGKQVVKADAKAKPESATTKKPIAASGQPYPQGRSTDAASKKQQEKSQEMPQADKPVNEAILYVSCKEGAQVFVDGFPKGVLSAGPMKLTLTTGKHKIIISHASFGVSSTDALIEAGQARSLKPKECN